MDVGRGVVVCTNKAFPYMDTAAITGGQQVFGKKSFHVNDYTFYYENIKVNVAARVHSYQAKHSGGTITGLAGDQSE